MTNAERNQHLLDLRELYLGKNGLITLENEHHTELVKKLNEEYRQARLDLGPGGAGGWNPESSTHA